jgi:hypothetical protein
MVPDISLDNQRPAEYVFSSHVEQAMGEIHAEKEKLKQGRAAAE